MYLDARSWMPVAWTISMEGPNGDRTMATFAKGVRQHGKPAFVYLDNGKDFRCLRFSGGRPRFAKKGETRVAEKAVRPILTLLGIESVFAIPFNAKAKVVEPFFRIVSERFDKTWPTYWGHKPDRRPEAVRKLDPATCPRVILEEFSGAFDRWILEDYALRESPSSAAAGLSAARAFLELRDPDFVPSRPDDATLSMLLMRSKAVTVQANGIYVGDFHRFYWSEKLDHLSAQDGSAKWAKVTYRFDPDDDSQIFVFKPNGQFLARAEPYIGSGLHPLAPRGSPESDRIGAVMALRRGRANRIQGEVQEARDFATNLLLRTSQDAARSLGRLDDPTTLPTPPGPNIQLIPDLTKAGQTRTGNREPGNDSRLPTPASPTAADILADRLERFKGRDGAVGAAPSALDILVNRKEQDHDDGDAGDPSAPA
jgi:hypothetical protein